MQIEKGGQCWKIKCCFCIGWIGREQGDSDEENGSKQGRIIHKNKMKVNRMEKSILYLIKADNGTT
jgi:hypothetical protein